jgi:GDP-L-fucose synthase
MKEEYILSGNLEKTNEPYAVAKILGLKMCESYNRQYKTNYISVMPTNLYGPGDTYHSELSHVIPSLILKTHKAKNENNDLILWGSGNPKREFLFVDDCAEACIFLMEKKYDGTFLNIGTGQDISIKDLADKITKMIDFKGKIIFDRSKPDGTPQKLLDVSKINSLGWKPRFDLDRGLKVCYKDYLDRFFKK